MLAPSKRGRDSRMRRLTCRKRRVEMVVIMLTRIVLLLLRVRIVRTWVLLRRC
jgi:hypothetical protein